MSEYRRFFAPLCEKTAQTVYLKEEYNHLAKVLRAKVGDEVIVCFNDGNDNFCRITSISADTVTAEILSTYPNKCESPVDITLYFGCLKGGNTDLVVQKAVELGVKAIQPFTSSFTVSSCDKKKAERLTKISHEASKQCGRAYLVDVKEDIPFSKLTEIISSHIHEQIIFCDERGGAPLVSAISTAKNIGVIIGSEGGFSIEEENQLCKIATGVTLGNRILRAETATFFALSVIEAVRGLK